MSCQGTRGQMKHSGFVYRCNNCGSVGCDDGRCTNQNFKNGRCQKCGKLDDKSRL